MKLQLEKKELVQLSDDPQVLPLGLTAKIAGGKHMIPSSKNGGGGGASGGGSNTVVTTGQPNPGTGGDWCDDR